MIRLDILLSEKSNVLAIQMIMKLITYFVQQVDSLSKIYFLPCSKFNRQFVVFSSKKQQHYLYFSKR